MHYYYSLIVHMYQAISSHMYTPHTHSNIHICVCGMHRREHVPIVAGQLVYL